MTLCDLHHRFYVPCCALTVYVMTFLGAISAASIRTSLNEAIVAMVNDTVTDDVLLANLSIDVQCPRDEEVFHAYLQFKNACSFI